MHYEDVQEHHVAMERVPVHHVTYVENKEKSYIEDPYHASAATAQTVQYHTVPVQSVRYETVAVPTTHYQTVPVTSTHY